MSRSWFCARATVGSTRRVCGWRRPRPDQVRAATGFSIGGVPPLGHEVELTTTIDESLRRFEIVWAAAGTPHDVFAVETEALIGAIPGARVVGVS